jgi:cell division protein FtsA
MPPPPVVALEVGTSKVVALVGEVRPDGLLSITGMGEHVSKGVRKSEVVDLENAVICVKGALRAAEESGQVTIRQVHLALSGGHIQSQVNRGSAHVQGRNREISEDDVAQVMDLARAVSLSPSREVLHTISQHFCVDDQESVRNPVGMEGARLSLDMLALHGVRNRLRNTVKAGQGVPMDVQDVVFGGLCAALAVLTPSQKEVGALVIDLGGGTTDYVAYAGNALADAGSLGVGGDHVTNDIALAFNISVKRAESLKQSDGNAIVDSLHSADRLTIPAEVGFPERSISRASLHAVVNARMDEVLSMVKHEVERTGVARQIGSGVVLTGGGARMNGIVKLAEEVFGLPCSVGRPQGIDGLTAAMEGPEYAVPVGAIRYGFASMDDDLSFSLGQWVKGLFGGGK